MPPRLWAGPGRLRIEPGELPRSAASPPPGALNVHTTREASTLLGPVGPTGQERARRAGRKREARDDLWKAQRGGLREAAEARAYRDPIAHPASASRPRAIVPNLPGLRAPAASAQRAGAEQGPRGALHAGSCALLEPREGPRGAPVPPPPPRVSRGL